MNYFRKIGLLLAICILGGTAHAANKIAVAGQIIDLDNRPIMAATITLISKDSVLTGTYSESDGSFHLNWEPQSISDLRLKVSSVGYATQTLWLDSLSDFSRITVRLDEKPINVGHIKVRPEPEIDNSRRTLSENKVELLARRSLVPSNPIAAVKQPQAVRQGSGHSSKIRLNGTNPEYYLNGINIGHDPNHYGMFSILPVSVVEAVSFMPQGTDARYQIPAVFALTTKSPYNTGYIATASLSTVEATATGSYGNGDFYFLGSLRKSVLDKLIENFRLETDKVTIPPTNFQDVYLSSGLKLTPDLELNVDGYQIRDYLSLKTAGTALNSSGIKSAQNTRESYLGSRLKFISGRTLITTQLAAKIGTEEYTAVAAKSSAGKFYVDLKATGTEYIGGLDISHTRENVEIDGGITFSTIPSRTVDLDHVNWNFLPPDANSDRPFVYQNELNRAFGSAVMSDAESKAVLHTTGRFNSGKFKMGLGLRAEQFGSLDMGRIIAVRNRFVYDFSEKTSLELFAGSFYESPSAKILDPYQVLIRYNLPNLKPVRTMLYSMTLGHESWRLGIFRKNISNLPVIDPDFEAVADDGFVPKEFFRMTSSGELSFYGGSFEIDLNKFPTSRTDVYTSYGYTHALNTYETVTVPYELNAEHKFYFQLNYSLSRKVNFGTDINLRSGFPYTPFTNTQRTTPSDRYTRIYYEDSMEKENSAMFPAYFSLGLYSEFRLGQLDIHLAVSNVTNHDNPIVNTADGYMFDAGILPIIGLKYTF